MAGKKNTFYDQTLPLRAPSKLAWTAELAWYGSQVLSCREDEMLFLRRRKKVTGAEIALRAGPASDSWLADWLDIAQSICPSYYKFEVC